MFDRCNSFVYRFRMTTAWLYILALIPVSIGFILWLLDREIVWWEWLLGSAASLALAAVFHGCALLGMTVDVETWSGQIDSAKFEPMWIEEYQESHDMTIGSGDDAVTVTWYTTEHRTHPERRTATTSTGETHIIGRDFFQQISRNFKDYTTETPYKYGFDEGDRNVYVAYNRTGYVYPTTTTRRFQNKLKGAPSLFRFTEAEASPSRFSYSGSSKAVVYDWPSNPNWLASDRLRGTAAIYLDQLQFDRMNTRLGPLKKVNVIMVGFTADKPEDYGRYQQAKWLGGKKNDLVLCFGGGGADRVADWAYAFGWTEKDNCKRNLEKLMREQPLGSNLLVAVEREIRKNYVIKDWTKFDYISVELPPWSVWVYAIVLTGSQFALYLFFHTNNEGSQGNPLSRLNRMLEDMNSRRAVKGPSRTILK